MAINDRIKDISTVRRWIRELLLFGDKTRSDFVEQSAYRHALEKVDLMMGDYLKRVSDDNHYMHLFLSMDARDVEHNPFFAFYKICAFRENDLRLHFGILNVLSDGEYKTKDCITDDLSKKLFSSLDHLAVYRKLEEYVNLGILVTKNQRNKKLYAFNNCDIDLYPLRYAIPFFSEIDPLGVIGDFLRSRLERMNILPGFEPLSFRHHYLHHVLDAEIVMTIAGAIHEKKSIIVENLARHQTVEGQSKPHEVIPIQFYHSVQSGRRYLVACRKPKYQLIFMRIDRIQSVTVGTDVPDYDKYRDDMIQRLQYVWGVSDIGALELTHLEMTIQAPTADDYTLKRIDAEKRHGRVEYLDDRTARFSIDVWEVREMLPWVRTFIGYIISLKCSNQNFTDQFKHDLREAYQWYQEE